MKSSRFSLCLIRAAFVVCVWIGSTASAHGHEFIPDTLLFQDWESGWGSWYADNGQWEVGEPTVGPDSSYSPDSCAGTILNGNYASFTDSRLISPQILLPTLSEDQRIRLRFRQWFRIENDVFGDDDVGYLQVRVDGGAWQTIPHTAPITGIAPAWSLGGADLSAYAGSAIRIGFFFNTDVDSRTDAGWYIDDVLVDLGPATVNFPENFDQGIGDWYADNGQWEEGTPTVGPASAFSPPNCMGTILGGNYGPRANSRLISPEVTLTPIFPGSSITLLYYQWYRIEHDPYGYSDYGYLQIRTKSGDWQNIPGTTPITGYNTTWSQGGADLTTFADSTVQIAFFLKTDDDFRQDNGWYIDDVNIDGIAIGIEENHNIYPDKYNLSPNYPDPFKSSTTIEFSLPRSCNVTLTIYNVLGQKVAPLVAEKLSAGKHKAQWIASDLAGGLYFCRLEAGEFSKTIKMVLLK